jgi:hypothetical protein
MELAFITLVAYRIWRWLLVVFWGEISGPLRQVTGKKHKGIKVDED